MAVYAKGFMPEEADMMLSDPELEDDWDSEEMQAALKIVLKYEIQSLLERLSQQGEETVLLTANRLDNCVGHLASSNAQQFVDSKDVGDLKVKFLTFLTDPHVPSDQYYGSGSANKPMLGVRGNNLHSESELKTRKLDVVAKPAVDNKTGKQVAKRPLEDVSMAKDKVGLQPVDPKRRKLDSVPSVPTQQIDTKQSTAVKTANVLPQAKPGAKGEIKLNTTKVVSQSGFVEERLSAAEFQKFLQQYDTGGNEEDYEEEEEMYDEEEEEEEDEYSELLEEGEIRFPYSQTQMYQQKQSGQKQLQTVNISVSNSGNAIINVNKGVVTKPAPKSQDGVKKLGEGTGSSIGDAAKKVQSNISAKDNSSDKTKPGVSMSDTSVTKSAVSAAGKVSEFKGPDGLANKVQDGDNKLTKKEQTKPVHKPSESVKSDNDNRKNVQQPKISSSASSTTATSSKGQDSFEGNVDDMDTDALVKMVKAKHAQSQSAADKQIQEKLGQLSSKLNWVVEYPNQKQQEQGAGGQIGPSMNPNQNLVFPPGFHPSLSGHFADDGEEEEEYDEEYDEDELDEHELEALAYMRKMQNKAVPSQVSGHFEGEIGEEEYGEDYDQEMEEFDTQHRVYDQMKMQQEFAGMGSEECSEDQGFAEYQRSASPSLENYLMIGSMMAKCLVCNKIVRKSEVKQHNKIHDEEYEEGEEGEEEVGEDGGEVGYVQEGEGLQGEGDGDGFEEKQVGFKGEEEYQEEYAGEEADEEEINMAEFTAQPLVAERLNPQQLALPCSNSEEPKVTDQKKYSCEICNKTFKQFCHLERHKKIHTKSKDFYCPVCNKSFKLKVYLQKHVKKMHPDYEAQASGGDGDGGAVAQDGGAEQEKVEKTQT